MKKAILLIIVMVSTLTFAQKNNDFGLKAGLNYNANGNYFESISNTAENPDRHIGFHIGVYGRFGKNLYFRSELVYTSTKCDYNRDVFTMKKLDIPLLVGVKIIGPINAFAGPSLQYILDTEFDGISIEAVNHDLTFGLNLGVGIYFNTFGLDLRYERGFTDNEASFINRNLGNDVVSRLDTRPDQLILSLSISL